MAQTKLKIYGLFDSQDGPGGVVFTAMINPEQIKHTRTMEIREKNVGNTAGPVTQYESFGTEALDFELYFDNTGVIPGSMPVDLAIAQLSSVIYEFKGQIHKPNYLLVTWAGFVFRCQLKSFNVDYTLFKPDGTPLRAKVALSFTQHKDPEQTEAEGNKNSPDLTHVKTVREGDSLPLLCKDVYGKMDYYIQVAEHNGLTNFRELQIGETLEFPPLDR